jgi:DNA-binding CsgD family transcriptional regulator
VRDAPIVIALAIDDVALADRLMVLLSAVAGIRLAAPDEPADATLIGSAIAGAQRGDGERALTPREQEVVWLLAEGLSNKAIARRLGISVHTAKFHVGQLLDKLDATGRTDAVAHAARLGVIDL